MSDHPAEFMLSRAEVKIVKKRKNRQNASFYVLFLHIWYALQPGSQRLKMMFWASKSIYFVI